MPGHDGRQYSGNSTAFDPVERHPRRTPSPPPGYYDRVFAPRNLSYRDEYQPAHRPDSRKPERAYYEGTPSPDRYSYSRTADETEWVRPSWRSPTVPVWQDRRAPPSTSDNGWGKPIRRDAPGQPLFEPSANWKQTHGMPGYHERRWSFEPRTADNIARDGERSPERGPPRDQYSPSRYLSNDRYRRLSEGSELRSSHSYESRSEVLRSQYSDSNAWTPSGYHTSAAYTSALNGHAREPQRPVHFDTRGAPRSNPQDKYQYLREQSINAGLTREDAASAHRSRSIVQDRQTDYVVPATKWYQRNDSPISRSPRSRVSSNTSPRRMRSRSRSSSRSSRGNFVPNSRTAIFDHDEMPYGSPGSPNRRIVADNSGETNSFVSPRELKLDMASVSETRAAPNPEPQAQEDKSVREEDRSKSSLPSPPGREPVISFQNDCIVVESPSGPERIMVDAETERVTGNMVRADLPTLMIPGAEVPLETSAPLASGITEARVAAPLPSPIVDATSVGNQDPGADERLNAAVEAVIVPPPEPMPMYEALRVLVMIRLQRDTQTREERVNPILMDNLSKVDPVPIFAGSSDAVVQEVTQGAKVRAREAIFEMTRPFLGFRFAQRRTELDERVQRLREEYLALHEQWHVHCSKLDDVAKNIALQEAAATAGRTTRRSLATMGDAVRSDLEMEQIIASLGTEEMTDANHLGARNAAVIPDMIIAQVGEVEYSFDDTNNQVENPAEYYAPHTGIHDWTKEEITIFVDKFAEFPKQFGVIADFLPHKTSAQCVTFYYLHKHRDIDFRQVVARRMVKKKRGSRKQKSNALLADIQQRDDEVTAPTRRRRTVLLPIPEPRRAPSRRNVALAEPTPTGTPTPEPEGEPRKRRRRITARATVGEEDDGNNEEEENDPKPAKRSRKARKPRQSSSTPLTTPIIMEDTPSFARSLPDAQLTKSTANGQDAINPIWSDSDKALFRHLLLKYGTNFELISASMPTKSTAQVAHFYQSHPAEIESNENISAVSVGFVPPLQHSESFSPSRFAPSTTYFEDGGPFDTQFSSHTYSREVAGLPIPFPRASPTSSNAHGSLAQATYLSGGPPRSYAQELPREAIQSVSHDSQNALTSAMSHLGMPSLGISEEHISNPSPFAAASPLSRFTYFVRPEFGGGMGFVDESNPSGRSGAGNSGSSMAFDATPSFVPAPQAWTRPPLQTTEDLVAYLEHRTKLARQ